VRKGTAIRDALLFLRRRGERGRKQAGEASGTSGDRFHDLAEVVFEGVAVVEGGRISEANRAFASMFGYELPAVVGKTLAEFVAPESRGLVEKSTSDGLGETCEAVGLKRDGTPLNVEMRARASSYGDRVVRVIAVRDVTGRKEQLNQAEERYRTLVEQVPGIIYVRDLAGSSSNRTSPAIYTSPQIEEQSGYPPQAFEEDPDLWVKLLHPADRERVLAEDVRTDETGEPFRMEYRQIRRDGRVVWVRDEAVLVRDEEGTPSYWLGIQHDITEQKRAESALKESELRLRTVITNAPVMLFALNLAGVFTLSEGRGLGALGLEPGEIVGHSVSELYGDRPEILGDVDRALAGEELSAVREVGLRTFEMWYSPLRANTGEVSGVIGIATDVTERRRAEEQVRSSEAELRALFEAMSDVILVLDSEGRYLEIAPTNPSLLYRPSDDLIGKTLHEVFPQEQADEFLSCIQRALEIRRAVNIEYSLRIGEREVWFAGSVSPMLEDRVIFVARDITEQKRAEETLREANRHLEKLAALRSDFTAMVAHEIGSPLASVRGFLEVLATGELEPADQADVLVKIRAEINRLSTLVADIRSAAAIERDDFALMTRPTAVDELFEDAVRFAETLPGDHPLTIAAEVDGRVLADPYRIGQVLRNLLSNAVKYSPDGAPIELRARPGETPGRIRIEVADRGRGVHPDDVDRIFERFGRGRDRSGRKAYGVGLGLYLSRRIVRAHGGELALDPAPDGGSVFSFELEGAA
jgi:PAS domain S-box-containing protein